MEGEVNIETQSGSSSKGNIQVRKRQSLLNLNEDEFIFKYCELKAKYDNLLENAGTKIYELSNKVGTQGETSSFDYSAMNDIRNETDEKLKQISESRNEEMKNLNEKYEQDKKHYEEKESELNKKYLEILKEKLRLEEELDASKKDYDSLQEMMTLTTNDIGELQSKVEKKKKKNHNRKLEIASLKEEIATNIKKFEELNKSISESETKNLENKQKVGDLSSKNEMMSLEIENLKNQLKQKDQLIGQQSNQIKRIK